MRKSDEDAEKANTAKQLKRYLKPNKTVYTVLRHCSSSGMTRHIVCLVAHKNQIINLTYYVAKLLGYKQSKTNGGLVVSGCGMDMGFHVVYAIGAELWPKGTSKPHGTRNGEPDTAGGYALKHEWL